MESLKQIPLSAIDFLFSQINEIQTKVTWIRNIDYTQQLYVGPNYQKVWCRPAEKLFEHPESWNETLVPTNNIDQIEVRTRLNPASENMIFYAIKDKNNNISFIKDFCFQVSNNHGEYVAVAGIAELIPQAQWEDEIRKIRESNTLAHELSISHLINDNCRNDKINQQVSSAEALSKSVLNNKKLLLSSANTPVELTGRETACLAHLSKGFSAKEIARYLNISPRTVEFHISNIKFKLGCRTSIEVISQYSEALSSQ